MSVTRPGTAWLLAAVVASACARGTENHDPQVKARIAGLYMRNGLHALYVLKDPASATVDFRKVLESNPAHYGATYQLAVALDRSGHPGEARQLWVKVRSLAEEIKDKATAETAAARLAANP